MIYLDNGATSFPKPPSVYEAVERYMRYCGASSGRAAHKKAREAMEISTLCRINAAQLLGVDNPEEIVFVKNATEGLNIIINGTVKEGDRVTVSPMEHNSVMRPLAAAKAEISVLPLNADGEADISALEKTDQSTRLVIINHVSNVSGAVNDIYLAGEICRKKGIPLLVDLSQSAGHFDTDAGKLHASVVMPGHKGLFGPQGTGIMYLHGIKPSPLCFGGTGSDSESIFQPEILPDYYESGTLNMCGIAGLKSGLEFILKTGTEEIRATEEKHTRTLREALGNMKGVRLTAPDLKKFGAVVSFTAENAQASEIALLLDEKYDIAVRSGLHCAPSAHIAYGTEKSGTVRISPGYFNTEKEINLTVNAINNIIKHS